MNRNKESMKVSCFLCQFVIVYAAKYVRTGARKFKMRCFTLTVTKAQQNDDEGLDKTSEIQPDNEL